MSRREKKRICVAEDAHKYKDGATGTEPKRERKQRIAEVQQKIHYVRRGNIM